MRNHFIKTIINRAKVNKNIFLMVGDLGYNVVEEFADTYPDRFLNVGIAEQNMMGMASGLASEGMHVFVYSIANFPTFRCAEQIRNDVDYHKLSVTIVSIGGGFSYGNLGYSHHAIQDYGLMRLMPNMLIGAPADLNETTNIIDYILKHPQPSYLRLDKSFNENLRKVCPNIKPGKWVLFKKTNSKNTILTTGNTLQYYKKLIKNSQFADYNIYSLPLWGHRFKNLQNKMLKQFNSVVTIEDHLLDAGFGSWLKECKNDNVKTKIKSIGFNSKYLSIVGDQNYLNKKSGLYFA